MAQENKICPYLDLPIQHIDDEILKRMGRRSKGAEIRSLLKKIRTFLPEVSLRSSLIVGFPGEKESQFKALLDFVEEIQFDHLGAFKYSPEEGTPASQTSSSHLRECEGGTSKNLDGDSEKDLFEKISRNGGPEEGGSRRRTTT